jgi:hypothetical protein
MAAAAVRRYVKSRLPGTVNACLYRKQRIAGSDEECAPVLAAEGDVCRPGFLHVDAVNLLTPGVEYRDALTDQVNVPLIINGHSIGTHVHEDFLVAEGTIGVDTVCVRLAPFDVGDIQSLPVRRADNTVRLLHVIDHSNQLFVLGRQVVNMLPILFHRTSRPVVPLVKRIGELDTPVGMNPDIVRPVQLFAFIFFH